MSDDTLFFPGLSPVDGHEIHARFDGGSMSSDGGVLLLREVERGLNFSGMLAACLPDGRDPGRTVHSQASMIRARILAIACGYEDCDDLDALRHDPALKIACERLPDSAQGLASQPTLSRLENLPSWRDLARMGAALIDLFCDSFATSPRHIMLDIDDTIDRTHGAQQLSLFNSYAGGYCFQPIHIYDAATQKPVCFWLRPGKRPSGTEAAMILRHVIRRIRANWPRVSITLRGDGHYGTPEVMAMLEQWDCGYILGLPVNSILKNIANPWCDDVAARWERHGKTGCRDKLRRFFQTRYGAASWGKERRVIARVEASEQGVDVRTIVTNLAGRGKHLYEKIYCARGKMENLIKEHKLYTKSDRTSCHLLNLGWQANQFRLFLHTGAYWLLLRLRAAAPKRSRWRTATFETIRRSFIKTAVRVEQLKSRLRIALPTACPHQKMLVLLAVNIKAQSP
ncbi:Mobile element protein [hydrothermal vent metagenome]|uniref:Mobile element protein n=1 Tax=hydrothermal vent metagenome TaxID=652676 RepID=A0A3B0RYU1_9ZZZZ